MQQVQHIPRIAPAPGAGAPLAVRRARQFAPMRLAGAARYKLGEYQENEAGPVGFDSATRTQTLTTGIVFQPAAALNAMLPAVNSAIAQPGPSGVAGVSLARQDYACKAEVAVNEQINVELNMSYTYLAMSAYFARDYVGLPGFSAHFKAASEDEREHAVLLMGFQTRRGGRVVLASLGPPLTEYENADKGDALYASSLALGLERLNFAKLRELHTLADEADDADMTHFLEDYLLDPQSRDVQEAAVLVSQLQRVGKGLGVFQVDYYLQRKYGVQGAQAGLANANGNGGDGGLDGGGFGGGLQSLGVTPLL